MKFVEISGSILLPMSNEENILLEKVKEYGKPLPKSFLNEREREVARILVNRGILTRIRMNDKLYFVSNLLNEMPGDPI
jgi:adenine-specific DNA methylase